MPEAIEQSASAHKKLPVRVEIAPPGSTVSEVTHELFVVPREGKARLLEKLLGEYRGSVLVFSRTKHGARKIARFVRDLGHAAAELHANRSLNQRREALDGFKTGRYRVLVATDIAARGIDVKGIELVVNYDLPTNAEDYVHRVGRTARAGMRGHAIAFATPDQRQDVRAIERFTRITLPRTELPDLPPSRVSLPTRFTEERHHVPRPGYRGRPPRRHTSYGRRGGFRSHTH